MTSYGFVGIVDIVDSTKIASRIEDDMLELYYGAFLNTMASIVRRYGGQVVKTVGDCLLYYFIDDLKGKTYNACLDCGIAMIHSREKINAVLQKYHLPCLHYRISVDYGKIIMQKALWTETTYLEYLLTCQQR